MNADSPQNHRLRHRQEQEHSSEQQQAAEQRHELMFESVEALLRHDAAQITPPAAIADRLRASIELEPKRPRSWWQRLFRSSGSE